MSIKKNSKVVLIYPPFVKTCLNSYYASLPILASELEKVGIESVQIDLNKKAFSEFFNLKYIEKLELKSEINTDLEFDLQIEHAKNLLKKCDNDEIYSKFEYKDVKLSNIYHALFDKFEESADINSSTINKVLNSEHEIYNELFLYSNNVIESIESKAIITFSVSMGSQIIPTLYLAKTIKKLFKNVKIIIGGPIISLLDTDICGELVESQIVDFLLKYEGENTLCRLVDNIWNDTELNNIENLTFYKNNEVYNTVRKYNTFNLNSSAIPKYDSSIINNFKIDSLSILQSRGCYWRKCSFCDYTNLYGDYKYNEKSPAKLVSEIKALQEEFSFEDFLIVNESMTSKYANEFSQLLINQNMTVKWHSFIKVDKNYFNLETVKKIEESGCSRLTIGVESFDNNVLTILDKGYTREDVEVLLSRLELTNIPVTINLIIDAPRTTLESALNQLEFCRKLSKKMLVHFNCFSFELTKTSKMGQSPEDYGLTIVPNNQNDGSMKGFINNKYNHEYFDKISKSKVDQIKLEYLHLNILSSYASRLRNLSNEIVADSSSTIKYKLNEATQYCRCHELISEKKYNVYILNSKLFLNLSDISLKILEILKLKKLLDKETINSLIGVKQTLSISKELALLFKYELIDAEVL
ncbi:MAG: radical SAM protein [Clostridiales bacterium]|nr:radical SAM protein [Clostridiales bacterium]